MSIPPRFLDDLRSRLTLSDIIGKRVRVIRAGREFKACCPFHKEKTPSFTINDDKQFYHCFGCGAHGDVIKFVMEHDNLEFMPAIELLAAEASMQVPKATPQEIKRQEEQKSLYDLLESTARWFQDQLYLPQNADTLDYIRGRGLTDETLKTFQIGFAPDDYDSLKEYLKKQGYTETQMLDAGVLKKSDRDAKTYSFFRDRIMVPVRDFRGRAVAFGGRVLPDHIRPPSRNANFKPPKYINSGDSEVFHKSRILYGGQAARMAAGQGKPVIVTEGYFDVIAAHQAGFTGAVAPMGTSLTEDQIMLLWKMIPADPGEVREPVLCFDGDNAGRRAAERACDLILPMLEAGRSARFAFLPQGEDPDSLIKSGGARAFQAVLENALPFFDFLWLKHTAGRTFQTPDSRAALTRALQTEILRINDRDVQKHYDSRLKDKIYKTFFQSPQNGKFSKKPANTPSVQLRSPLHQAQDLKSRILLAAVLNYPDIYEQVEEQFWQFEIPNPAYEKLRQIIIQALNNDPGLDRSALHSQIGEDNCQKELDDILSSRTYMHAQFCAPGQNDGAVSRKWLELWQSIQDSNVQKEIRQGWRKAFDSADALEEEKLRDLLRQNGTE